MQFKNGKEGGVPGLSRGLMVLEYLCLHGGGARIRTLADAIGVPDNSMIRVLQTLCDHGYLSRDPDSLLYSVTHKISTLSCQMADDRSLIECALPSMRKLRDEIGESTVLAVWDKSVNSVVIVHQVPARFAFRFVCDYGYHPILHVSSSTKAVVAYFSKEERDRILNGYKFQPYTETTIKTRKAFEEELALVRERGYALDHGEQMSDILCASAPVFDSDGSAVASITVTGPSFRVDIDKDLPVMGAAVKSCAERITRLYTAGSICEIEEEK